MSGICGLYRFNKNGINQEELYKITQSMASIGPDGTHVWKSDCVGFGHAAFHLTLESNTEVLPYYDPILKLAITADCRLDNRKALCEQFKVKDDLFQSDSFLILKAYQRWGKNCPQYLLGEFAVVIWDESAQELISFTDHTGQRTFHYYHDAHLFAFSTEIAPLHTIRDIKRAPCLEYIAAYESLGYRLNRPEMTVYENIFKATARTLISVKNSQLHRQIYWQPDINKRILFKSEDEYIEAFQALFGDIVQAKLRSDYPVLTLHSGGLDSSSITAMASHLLIQEGRNLTALSATLPENYQGRAMDESAYIHLLQKPNLSIQSVSDVWRGPFDGLDDARYCASGFYKGSRYYLYKAFATAASSHGARIILDGSFGEKGPSFHGNGYFAELLLNMRWWTLLRESCFHAKRYDRSWIKCLVREGLFPLLPESAQAGLSLRSDIAFSKQASFIKSSFVKDNINHKLLANERLTLNTQYPNHRHHQYQAISYLHAPHFLVDDDSGNPIHFSYPYNDKRMLEFCLAIPGNFKVRNGYKRYAIRSGMRGLMPDKLRFRITKEPFSPDYHERYNQQISKARDLVERVENVPLIREIINIERLKSELNYKMQSNNCRTKHDFTAMHTLPVAVYLMAFLATF